MLRSNSKSNSSLCATAAAVALLSFSAVSAQNQTPSTTPIQGTQNDQIKINRDLDPVSSELLARTREASSLEAVSATTNFQRGLACEKMGQMKAALTYFDKSVQLIKDNPDVYKPEFIRGAYEHYAQVLDKSGNKKLAAVIRQAYSRSQAEAAAPTQSQR